MQVSAKGVSGRSSSFECCEGSHVFFESGSINYFREWEALSEELKAKFTALRDALSDRVNTVNSELSQVLCSAVSSTVS